MDQGEGAIVRATHANSICKTSLRKHLLVDISVRTRMTVLLSTATIVYIKSHFDHMQRGDETPQLNLSDDPGSDEIEAVRGYCRDN